MSGRDAILESLIQQIDLLSQRIDTATEPDRSAVLRESGFLLGVLREVMDRGHLPKAVLHDMVEIQEDLIQQVVRLSQDKTPQAAAADPA
jgi:hypothetical protein